MDALSLPAARTLAKLIDLDTVLRLERELALTRAMSPSRRRRRLAWVMAGISQA